MLIYLYFLVTIALESAHGFNTAHYAKNVQDNGIDKVDSKGKTLLYTALNENNITMAKSLIENGLDINVLLPDQKTLLHLAAINGDDNAIKHLLNMSKLINKVDIFGRTPLHYAAINGQLTACQILISNGANLFAKDENDNMPIHVGVQKGQVYELIIQTFLDQDSNLVEARGTYDYTPLHLASYYGFTEIILLLQKYDANVFAVDIFNDTPIHIACQQGRINVVKLFIDHNASLIEMKGALKYTPLHYAVSENHFELTKYILTKHADVSATANYDDDDLNDLPSLTALHLAAVKGNPYMVDILLQYNAPVYAIDIKGNMPIHVAILNENIESVQKLLNFNPSLLNARDNRNNTLLHLAAGIGSEDILKILLTLKADVFAVNRDNDAPIHLACQHGRTNAVRLFIDYNTSLIEMKGALKYTPLHYAVQNNHFYMTKYLLTKHADVSATANYDDDGVNDLPSVTALHLAAIKGYTNMVDILLQYNASVYAKTMKGYMPIHVAVLNKNTEAVQKLLNFNPRLLQAQDNWNNTLLHLAAAIGSDDILKILLTLKADVFAVNRNNDAPIHIACLKGRMNAVRLFIDFNASLIEMKGSTNNTPLHLAAKYSFEDILKLLLNKQADVFAKNIDNDKPIHLAIKRGRLDSFLVLVQHNPKLINVRGYSNFLPLHYAVNFSRIEILEWLIKYGANVDSVVDEDALGKGTTGLHLAAKYNLPNSLCMLLYHGANISIEDRNNDTPISLAFKQNATEVYHILNEYRMMSNHKRGKIFGMPNLTMGLYSFGKCGNYSIEIQSLASSSPNGQVVSLGYFSIPAALGIIIVFGFCFVFFRKRQLHFKTITEVKEGFSPGSNAKDLKIFVQNKKSENMINLKYSPVTLSMEKDSERSSQTNTAVFGNARAV